MDECGRDVEVGKIGQERIEAGGGTGCSLPTACSSGMEQPWFGADQWFRRHRLGKLGQLGVELREREVHAGESFAGRAYGKRIADIEEVSGDLGKDDGRENRAPIDDHRGQRR